MKGVKLLTGLTALALLLAVLGAQCPGGEPAQPTAVRPMPGQPTSLAAAPTSAPAAPPSSEGATSGTGGGANAPGAGPVQPMIVKTATLSMVVPDVEGTITDLTRITATAGGYISTSQTDKRGDRLFASIVLRVPVSAFEATLERVRALGKDILSYRVEGTDVTAEYVDLESRLRHLEALEKELLTIMTEIRAKSDKAEEVLKIYDRVLAVQAEIETVKGRMQYLSNLASFSTITVDLEEEVVVTPTPTPTLIPTPTPVGWHPEKTLDSAVSSWVAVVQRLVDFGIWLSVYSTCLIPLALVGGVVLVVVYFLRRRASKTAS